MSQVRITHQVLDAVHEGEPLKPMLSHEYLTEADCQLIAAALRFYVAQGQHETFAESVRVVELSTTLTHANEWE